MISSEVPLASPASPLTQFEVLLTSPAIPLSEFESALTSAANPVTAFANPIAEIASSVTVTTAPLAALSTQLNELPAAVDQSQTRLSGFANWVHGLESRLSGKLKEVGRERTHLDAFLGHTGAERLRGKGVRATLFRYSPPVTLHVVLVEPEIHWNTGAVGRSCLGAGAQLHLVEPLGFSLDESRVRRAGLDYWPRVNPRLWPSWSVLETEISSLGEPFFFSTEGARSYWDVQYPERTVLVFGKESVGLAPEIRERWRDRLVSIPMFDPHIRSLNLSNSVALTLWEVLRQRRVAAPAR